MRGDAADGVNQITAASIPKDSSVPKDGDVSSNTTAPGATGTTFDAARNAALGTGGSTGTIGTIVYRVYVPASGADATGGAGLPRVSVVAGDGKASPVPACPNPGPGPNVEALISTYGPPTDTPAPPTPVFLRPARGNNLFPNPDNIYVATIVDHEPGRVVVVRGRAPTFPNTRAGQTVTGNEQVRFWSLCTNEYRKPYPASSCKRDDETALDGGGQYTFVISTPEDRPTNATPENGITWIDTGNRCAHTPAAPPHAGQPRVRRVRHQPRPRRARHDRDGPVCAAGRVLLASGLRGWRRARVQALTLGLVLRAAAAMVATPAIGVGADR